MNFIKIFTLISILILMLCSCSSTSNSSDKENVEEVKTTYKIVLLEDDDALQKGFNVDKRSGCLYVHHWGQSSSYLSPVLGSNGHFVGCEKDSLAESVDEYLGNLKNQ